MRSEEQGWSKGEPWEAVTLVQAGDNDGLNYCSSSDLSEPYEVSIGPSKLSNWRRVGQESVAKPGRSALMTSGRPCRLCT